LNQIKICFINPKSNSLYFPDLPIEHGGAETQLYFFSQEIAKNDDFHVSVILNGPREDDFFLGENLRGFRVPLIKGLQSKIDFQYCMKRVNADIYIQRGGGSITKEVAFFCRWARKKFIYWVASDADVDPEIRQPDSGHNRWFEWGMKNASLIISQTKHQKHLLVKNYNKESILLPKGFPNISKSNASKSIILWVGRLHPVKRPELFIELARLIPDEHFVMIGPVYNEITKSTYEKCSEIWSNLDNFEYIPECPLNEIQKFFNEAKILVNTSIHESYPNTFVQAMLGSSPIASLNHDPDNIIRDHKLGVPPYADFNQFADHIKILLNHPSERLECGKNAFEYVIKNHDLSKVSNQLAAIFRNLIKSK
jgi:glycosyltransferase involved in cell wall biosynthesis